MSDGRHVEFEHCFNFRDIGGYETADGRRVRRNAVFRSDSLHRLTTADLTRAQDLGVAGRDALATALRVIAEGDHAVVFHCAAGKDRTGILAALVLSTLGVPDEVIIADYTLSDRALAPAIAWAEANDRRWADELATLPSWLLHAPTKVMQEFRNLLRAEHG